MEQDLELKRFVMRRVYRTWFLRRVAPILAIEAILLFGVLAGVMTSLSPRNILLNAFEASSNIVGILQFFIDNFFVKSIQSQLLALLYLVFAGMFVRDLYGVVRKFKKFEYDISHFAALGNRR